MNIPLIFLKLRFLIYKNNIISVYKNKKYIYFPCYKIKCPLYCVVELRKDYKRAGSCIKYEEELIKHFKIQSPSTRGCIYNLYKILLAVENEFKSKKQKTK